jgi:hypothetical protein
MASRASRFSQTDLTRALRGAEKAGMMIQRVEIETTGKIVIFGGTPAAGQRSANPWDEELSR